MKTFERLLFSAVSAKDADLVKLCCEAGADVLVRNEAGMTPLDIAVINGSRDIASLILTKGADPRSVTRDGIAALGLASARNDVPMLRILSSFCAAFEAPATSGKGCLQVAVEAGANSAIDYLLMHGADPNAVDEAGNSLLQIACSLGNHELALKLLEHGADATHRNYFGRSVLEDAIFGSQYRTIRHICAQMNVSSVEEILRTVAASHATNNEELGQSSSAKGLIRIFLTYGRIKGHTLARKAAEKISVLAAKRQSRVGLTPTDRLLSAIEVGDIAAAVASLAAGADARATTTTKCPAIVAAAQIPTKDKAGVCHLVLSLIDRGADIASRDPNTGETTLHVACRTSHTLTVMALLQTVDGRKMVNASDKHLNRPLHLATMARDYETIAELFRVGADMNPVNRDGFSPLHLAAMSYDVPTAAALLRNDANPSLRTNAGRSVRQCIKPNTDPALFQALLDNEKARRQRPSIFSSHHPLASLATSPMARQRLK